MGEPTTLRLDTSAGAECLRESPHQRSGLPPILLTSFPLEKGCARFFRPAPYLSQVTERWLSGLKRTPGKRVWA